MVGCQCQAPAFLPQEKDHYKRLGGHRSGLERSGKSSPLPVFDPLYRVAITTTLSRPSIHQAVLKITGWGGIKSCED